MERCPISKIFCPKTPCSQFQGCVEECCVALPSKIRRVFGISGLSSIWAAIKRLLISNSRETQILLREMREKPTVSEITSHCWNIIGIRKRSRVLNNVRDFDLAMWSTYIGWSVCELWLPTLKSNCGLCRVFLNWPMKWYLPLACLRL